jgi:tetratricopeptide (TPR) repeat protein
MRCDGNRWNFSHAGNNTILQEKALAMLYKSFMVFVVLARFLCHDAVAQATTETSDKQNPTPTHESSCSAQLFQKIGSHQRGISTSSTEAQEYFDQGLMWVHAFNHDEAIRSFLHAAALDPNCAMAWWGVAYCEGPNYNDEIMTESRSKAAWYALQNALARIDNTSPVERSLIEALTHRYANPWPEERTHLEQAYADAMAQVWEAYPEDTDVGTLYAESLMVQKPWKLYTLDQQPVEGTDKILSALQRVLEINPNHPGANHLFVHAVEPSANPGDGLEAARRLNDLVQVSGHLLHMPSHIYVKTGYWKDAIDQNVKAMAADEAYRALSPKQGLQHLYMVHNAHMLAYAAMMSGREKEALAAARAMWANIPDAALKEVGPIFDLWMCSVYDVQKRFGRWDAILAEDAPPDFLPVTTAIWRAHRAIAFAAKKDFENAQREYEAFRLAKTALPEDHMAFSDLAHTILDVSDNFIAGEIALQRQDWDTAAQRLKNAIEIEDSLTYGEPPQWLQPVRHTLGAVYLKAQRFEDAERTYREDLEKWPNNGWSLYGLSRSLEGQGKAEEAHGVKAEYERAWARADAPIDTSCKCLPKT